MMKLHPGLYTLLLLLLLLIAPVMAHGEEDPRREVREAVRGELRGVERAAAHFVRGEFDIFDGYLASTGSAVYTAEQLERLHEMMERLFGEHRHTQAAFGIRPPSEDTTRGAIVPVDLRNGEVDLVFGWRGEFGPGAVTHFRITARSGRPSHTRPPRRVGDERASAPPPYVYTELFEEQEVEIPRRRIPNGRGKIAIPNRDTFDERLPAALIVGELHSSGFDSARGYLKPRRDLALGLASQGVVTLRIAPRDPREPGWTLESHLLSDMREGLRLLHNHDRVDPKRLYIVGHEVGGIMATALAREISILTGVVLIGTPDNWTPTHELARSGKWHDTTGYPATEEMAVLRGERQLLINNQMPSNTLWAGFPWHFWEDLQRRDAIALMTGFERRLLHITTSKSFLHDQMGSRRWNLLGETLPRATFTRLELGYWMTPPGESDDSPETLQRHQHVSLELVDTVANWLKLTPNSQ